MQEYWIVDWRLRQVEIYRREDAQLQAVSTLFTADEITSPQLPGFEAKIERLF